MGTPGVASADIRHQIREAVAHLGHVLPAQAPIRDFVHHNTLHGFQHLDFTDALAQARRLTGNLGYLPAERFREFFAQGRIGRDDLIAVLDANAELAAGEVLLEREAGALRCRDVYLGALLHPLKPVTGYQLTWQIEELDALGAFQPDVEPASRARLLAAAHPAGEAGAIADLWSACLEVLGLEHYVLHPEELLDLSPDQAERMLAGVRREANDGQPVVERQMRTESVQRLLERLERVGPEITLRGLLKELTGEDLLEEMRPLIVRHLGAYLDQGLAAWHAPDTDAGFYRAWRATARHDLTALFEDLRAWHDELESLPPDALEAIIAELKRMGLPRERWTAYLERLALEIPGWSGMFLWRDRHPGYQGLPAPVAMLDYLAVRLVLERIFARRLCRQQWQIEASLDMLRWYFRRNPAEFLVRHAVFAGRLPEYLAARALRAATRSDLDQGDRGWEQLAKLIWTWRRSPSADRPDGHTVFHSAWPLFRLAQHLGLAGADLRALGAAGSEAILDCLGRLGEDKAGLLWLQAYERHYRDRLFDAVLANHGRGRWQGRDERPAAQVVFCMDDREEGVRRHLEEINPRIETLGAAGFFGVSINWRGLDDETVTALCPVVVTPAHEVRELARPEAAACKARHDRRRAWRLRLADLLHQELRRNLLSSILLVAAAAPLALIELMGKVIAPLRHGRLAEAAIAAIDGTVPTEVAICAADTRSEATPEHPRLGFTDTEQADRVQGFLRTIGLQQGFAPFVALMGHGSWSQNNPHRAAYDCGACSGRHGGPNARVFAAMANRPQVRALLRGRGIEIPEDTWFLGAERNTCTDIAEWYDLDRVPAPLYPALVRLTAEIAQANALHAVERCRRFASAPLDPPPGRGHAHVMGRAQDFSQARPELGHATNAAAFIGRRALSRGVFFDRRVFLISYDPTQDPEGKVLEAILLAVGPVGAGINLEYYFSTVDNDRYGCGSKVTHNVAGFFGVMDGTASDLRTGLPRQMIEIHEAMRLQVLVEAKTEVLTAIYQRQPPLQELVGKGWLLLGAKDPDAARIQVFDPARGWLPWAGTGQPLPRVGRSADWFRGHREPLAPALIARGA